MRGMRAVVAPLAGLLTLAGLLMSGLAGSASPAGAENVDRVTVQIGVDAHGLPAEVATSVAVSCGAETFSSRVDYGGHWVLDVPTTVGPCTLSHTEPSALGSELALFVDGAWSYRQSGSVVFDPNVVNYLWVFDFYPSPWSDLELFVEQLYLDITGREATDAEVLRALDEVIVEGRDVSQMVMGLVEGVGHYSESVEPVARLYRAFFLRDPDPAGLGYWVGLHQQGVSLPAIAEEFALSEEFQLRYGALDDAGYVELIYANVLQRSPDVDGSSYWRSEMDAGLSRGGVMTWFSEGAEFGAAVDTEILIDWAVTTFLRRPATEEDHAVLSADARYGHEAVMLRVLTSGYYFNRFWFQGESTPLLAGLDDGGLATVLHGPPHPFGSGWDVDVAHAQM